MSSKKDTCSKIIIPAQTGPICWFMSTFVAMFYSQRSRKILIEASKYWDKQFKIFSIFDDILKNKNYDYSQFNYDIFEPMLIYLNNTISAKSFSYNPRFNKGFIAEIYIGRLYKLLNIDSIIFEYNPTENWLAYSIFNEEFDNIISWKFDKNNFYEIIDKQYDQNDRDEMNNIIHNYKKKILPPVLIVIVRDVEVDSKYTKLYREKFPEILLDSAAKIHRNDKENIESMTENITYMGVNYTLDSVILSNWNRFYIKMGHAIAGITCKNKRYIYNSWPRETNDYLNIPYACKLMKHDWMENQNFCLNIKDCIPIHLKNEKHIIKEFENKDYCFNFMNGSRVLIYIRNDITSDNSSSPFSPSSPLPSSIHLPPLSRSSSLHEHEKSPEDEKSKVFELILMTMKMIVDIITPFLNKNKTKLYTKMINIDDLENTDNLFIKFIQMIILLFQKLVNEKINELELLNEQKKLLNNIISESNNNLSHSRNTSMSHTKNIVSHKITTMYTHNYTKKLSYKIIRDIPQNSRLYKKFNSLFHKFCLSIYLIILYAQVVGINDEEIFLMSNNNLISSSRITQLTGGKQVKKSKKTPKKKA